MTPRQNELFKEHRDLCERVAREIHGRHGTMNGLELDDYRQLALMGLCDSIIKYRPSRGKFVRYAYKRIRGYVRDEIRKADEVGRSRRAAGQRGPVISLEHPVLSSDADRMVLLRDLLTSPKHSDRMATFDAIRLILDGLDRDARFVVFLTEVMELPQGQVASVLGIGTVQIGRIRKHALEYLRGRKSLLAC